MIHMEKLVNYEENKDDPNWNDVLRKLQESQGVFKIGKLIVHPGANIDVPSHLPSKHKGETLMDLDVLELVSGIMSVYAVTRIKGGHLAYSEAETDIGTWYVFQCKSEKAVCDEYKGFVLKQNSELIIYADTADRVAIDLGTNSRLVLSNGIPWWRGVRDPSSFTIGDNSQVDFNIDFFEEFHIEVGNNCKVLYTGKALAHASGKGQTAETDFDVVQIKKLNAKAADNEKIVSILKGLLK